MQDASGPQLHGQELPTRLPDDEAQMEERPQDGSLDEDMSPRGAPSGSSENGPRGGGLVSSPGGGHVPSPQGEIVPEASVESTSMIESLVNAPGPTDEVSEMR